MEKRATKRCKADDETDDEADQGHKDVLRVHVPHGQHYNPVNGLKVEVKESDSSKSMKSPVPDENSPNIPLVPKALNDAPLPKTCPQGPNCEELSELLNVCSETQAELSKIVEAMQSKPVIQPGDRVKFRMKLQLHEVALRGTMQQMTKILRSLEPRLDVPDYLR